MPLGLALLVIAVAACGASSSTTKQEPPANTVAQASTPKLAADGQPGDRCDVVIKKSRAVLDELFATYTGKKITDDELTVMLAQCRKPEEQKKSDKLLSCVIVAADQAAVAGCWRAEMNRSTGDEKPREKQSEAAINLNRIAKNSKTVYAATAQYIVGTATPLPVGKCGCPDKCAVTSAWHTDPVWRELEFEISEVSLYIYTYESDGKTFKATATADLDCDGNPSVWVLEGTTENGNAVTTIAAPAKGVY